MFYLISIYSQAAYIQRLNDTENTMYFHISYTIIYISFVEVGIPKSNLSLGVSFLAIFIVEGTINTED